MSILGTIALAAIPVVGIPGLALRFLAPVVFKRLAGGAVERAKGIPPKGWLAIGIVVALIAGFFVHQHFAHKARDAAYAAGRADEAKAWQKRLDDMHAAALRWKAKAEATQGTISKEVRESHDKDLRDIGARADDQRMRGPGQAAAPACVRSGDAAGLPAAAGRPDPASGAADPGLAGVPPESGLAIVPWSGLVTAGQLGDGWRSEVIAWREWYARQNEANRRARESAPGGLPPRP